MKESTIQGTASRFNKKEYIFQIITTLGDIKIQCLNKKTIELYEKQNSSFDLSLQFNGVNIISFENIIKSAIESSNYTVNYSSSNDLELKIIINDKPEILVLTKKYTESIIKYFINELKNEKNYPGNEGTQLSLLKKKAVVK